ncbi:MAG: rhomboid family intramembrane serine protease [Minisyncoccia bacterium]
MLLLSDEKKISNKKPIFVFFLILINILFFLYSLHNFNFFIKEYGLIPQKILEGKKILTLFTYMFLHGNLLHLLGNMWFLWVFGKNLEKKLGHLNFLKFYFICGLFSSIFYVFFSKDLNTPLIGASGAISGILGGYLIFFPKNQIKTLIPFFFFLEIISIPAIIFILIWFLYQLINLNIQTSVAYLAHIGGFLCGLVLAKNFKR